MPTVLRVCSEPPEVRPAPVRAGGLGRLCARLVRMRTAVLVLRLTHLWRVRSGELRFQPPRPRFDGQRGQPVVADTVHLDAAG